MIDHYCERVGPGLMAEPLNAISSLAFVAVAVVSWREPARNREAGVAVAILIALVAAVGAASFAWHSLATSWARWFDIAALLAFQIAWLWIYLRRTLGVTPRPACLVLLGFGLSLLPAAVHAAGSNGLLLYLPTLAMLFALGLHRRLRARRAANPLLVAAALFAIALALRTADASLCTVIPAGTHFAWHLLTALVVWLALRALSGDPSSAVRDEAG